MALIGRLIDRLLKRGSITIVTPDGKRETYGPGGGKSLTIRITDRKVLLELDAQSRGSALGEAYMDGRLIDRGRRRSSTCSSWSPAPTAGKRAATAARRSARASSAAANALFRRNRAAQVEAQRRPSLRPRRTSSTSSSSTTTGSTAAPISPIPPTASSRRRPTRRRISPPSSTSSRASACSTSAAAGAGWRSICTRSPRSTCSASPCPKSS